MIAIITSTLQPASYSYFKNDERYNQTVNTINKLELAGFDRIFLFDNSPAPIDAVRIQTATSQGLRLFHAPQYSFQNKGLSEALLILNNLNNLPDDEIIFKVSARYYPTELFDISNLERSINGKEITGVAYDFKKKVSFFSTRSYAVNNKKTLESILTLAVEEMISYSRGIHGLKSFLSFCKGLYQPIVGAEYQLSLEQAFARVMKAKFDFRIVEKMHIEGYIAGSDRLDLIRE